MSEKIPHRKVVTDFGWKHVPVELTGKCKRVTYPGGKSYEYMQCQRRIFGIKCGKFWEYKEYIVLLEETKVEYYDCNCSE